MTLYEFLKYIHVVLAIVAIGFNISYGVWLSRAAREPVHAAYVLRGLKVLDDRFANPAYALLLITGLGMVFEADIPLDTFWILTSLIIYAGVIVVGVVFYSPILRRQTEIAEGGMADTAEYRQLSKRNTTVGGLLVLMVLAIEFLMVTKPTL